MKIRSPKQNIEMLPESSSSQEPSGLTIVIHVWNGTDGIVHFVVHDGIHMDCHRVFSQDLVKNKLL